MCLRHTREMKRLSLSETEIYPSENLVPTAVIVMDKLRYYVYDVTMYRFWKKNYAN